MKASVCLATYNGSAYIAEQIRTILDDIEEQDELIICDDDSGDNTVQIIEKIVDTRVRFHKFNSRVHHVENFERTLKLATGEIIFFSDQDDIWVKGKRSKIMQHFFACRQTVLVVHAVSEIDSHGRTINACASSCSSFQEGQRKPYRYLIRQLVKSQVLGCACAFRRELLEIMLPFPRQAYAHDHWLSVAAPFAGKVLFLNDALVEHRLHEGNLSPKTGLTILGRLTVRLKLLQAILIAARRAFLRRRVRF